MLEEKEKLLKLLERRELMNSHYQHEAEKKIEADFDSKMWSKNKRSHSEISESIHNSKPKNINNNVSYIESSEEKDMVDKDQSPNQNYSPLRQSFKHR